MPSEQPFERLRRPRIAKGYASARDAARQHGWNEVTYVTHENGTRGLRLTTARVYAKAFGVPVGELIGVGTPEPNVVGVGIKVIGEAAIGIWRETNVDNQTQTSTVPDDHPMQRFAVRVADHSVDKIIGAGDYAVCEPTEVSDIQLGNFVAVRRTRQGLTELSIRRVSDVSPKLLRATGHSTDSRYSPIVDIQLGAEATIIGRVIGKYTDLPF